MAFWWKAIPDPCMVTWIKLRWVFAEHNKPPVAKVPNNMTIFLPTSTVILNGTNSTDDQKITSYKWTQVRWDMQIHNIGSNGLVFLWFVWVPQAIWAQMQTDLLSSRLSRVAIECNDLKLQVRYSWRIYIEMQEHNINREQLSDPFQREVTDVRVFWRFLLPQWAQQLFSYSCCFCCCFVWDRSSSTNLRLVLEWKVEKARLCCALWRGCCWKLHKMSGIFTSPFLVREDFPVDQRTQICPRIWSLMKKKLFCCFSGSNAVQIDNFDRAVATVSKLSAGTYKFKLVVKDEEDLQSSATMTVTVKESKSPQISLLSWVNQNRTSPLHLNWISFLFHLAFVLLCSENRQWVNSFPPLYTVHTYVYGFCDTLVRGPVVLNPILCKSIEFCWF